VFIVNAPRVEGGLLEIIAEQKARGAAATRRPVAITTVVIARGVIGAEPEAPTTSEQQRDEQNRLHAGRS